MSLILFFQCVNLSTAMNLLMDEYTDLQIEYEPLEHLGEYAKVTHARNEKRAQILEELPLASQRIHELAVALERSQNSIEVVGAKVDPVKDFPALKALLDENVGQLGDLKDGLASDNSVETAEKLSCLRKNLSESKESYENCEKLVQTAMCYSVKKNSLQHSLDTSDVSSEELFNFNLPIPPKPEVPKLVDIST